MYVVSSICVVDCKDHYDCGSRTDGVYSIYAQGLGDRSVYCDMTGGGRTVLQRRLYGYVNFDRRYDDYINGFGDVAGDHWLGLELMHLLTTRPGATNSLLIVVHGYDGMRDYMNYANVWVDDRNSGYKLQVTQTDQDVSSPNLAHMPGIALHATDGRPFTTLDHDVDADSTGNCATTDGGGGGWWYKSCSFIFINGKYGVQNKGGIGILGLRNVPIYATNAIMSVMRN
jgi:ficolin